MTTDIRIYTTALKVVKKKLSAMNAMTTNSKGVDELRAGQHYMSRGEDELGKHWTSWLRNICGIIMNNYNLNNNTLRDENNSPVPAVLAIPRSLLSLPDALKWMKSSMLATNVIALRF